MSPFAYGNLTRWGHVNLVSLFRSIEITKIKKTMMTTLFLNGNK